MWVIFTKNYSGEHGFFCKDQKTGDISNSVAKELISKKFCKKTCAPWEEQKDNRTIRIGVLHKQQQVATADLTKQENQKIDLLADIEKHQKNAEVFGKIKSQFGKLHKDLCEKMIEIINIKIQLCDLNIDEATNALNKISKNLEKLKAKAKK